VLRATAAPIYDASRTLLGITCSSVDLRAITDQAKSNVLGMRDGRVFVIDGERRRIADSAATERLAPEDVSTLPVFACPASFDPELRFGEDHAGREVRGFTVGLRPSGLRLARAGAFPGLRGAIAHIVGLVVAPANGGTAEAAALLCAPRAPAPE
jgi:hypothetical protein